MDTNATVKRATIKQFTSNQKAFTNLRSYVMGCLDREGGNRVLRSDRDKLSWFIECWRGEYNTLDKKELHPVLADRLAEYLKGLGGSIQLVYTYDEIYNTATSCGYKLAGNKYVYTEDAPVARDMMEYWFDLCAECLIHEAKRLKLEF